MLSRSRMMLSATRPTNGRTACAGPLFPLDQSGQIRLSEASRTKPPKHYTPHTFSLIYDEGASSSSNANTRASRYENSWNPVSFSRTVPVRSKNSVVGKPLN